MKKIIRLNRNFYSQEAINATTKAFSHLCRIEFIDEHFTIKIEADSDIDVIAYEFCNYCLSMVKEYASS